MPGLVSGVILAAGSARRMNAQKLLLDVGGRPLVRTVADEAAAARLAEILVVVSNASETVVTEALDALSVRIVTNPRAADGMGTSVAAGAAAVSEESDALILLQGDQPLVVRSMLRRLIDAWQPDRPPFVASRYDGLVTTPVLFDRAVFPELRELDGDRGAKSVLDRHSESGRTIDFPAWRGADVDTPEDYRRVREIFLREHPPSTASPAAATQARS
jgi:molybdenum cofactor cytidylyltransferase